MMEYSNLTISDFLKQLSSKKSVPGGGSATALEASLAAAMHLMVLNYSDSEIESPTMRKLKTEQQKSLDILKGCIDEDAEAFGELMRSFSSGSDPQARYKAAAEVPLKVIRECLQGLLLAETTKEHYNKRLVTDLFGAINAFKCAAHSSFWNIEINLKYIKDKRYTAETGKEAREILDAVKVKFDDISEAIKGDFF